MSPPWFRIGPVVALKTERRRRRQGRLGHESWPAPTMRLGRMNQERVTQIYGPSLPRGQCDGPVGARFGKA
jgi:hypothetical protein